MTQEFPVSTGQPVNVATICSRWLGAAWAGRPKCKWPITPNHGVQSSPVTKPCSPRCWLPPGCWADCPTRPCCPRGPAGVFCNHFSSTLLGGAEPWLRCKMQPRNHACGEPWTATVCQRGSPIPVELGFKMGGGRDIVGHELVHLAHCHPYLHPHWRLLPLRPSPRLGHRSHFAIVLHLHRETE